MATADTPTPSDPIGEALGGGSNLTLKSLAERVTVLEGQVNDIGKVNELLNVALQNRDAAVQLAQNAPETAHYQCSLCVEEGIIDPATGKPPVIEAIHPARWFAAHGPIECPIHPSRAELMVCLEMRDAAAKEAAAAEEAALAQKLAPKPAPLPAPSSSFEVPEPPPIQQPVGAVS